jgi:hypothetical protein
MRFYVIEQFLVSIGHLERKIISENISLVMVPNNMEESLVMVPERKIILEHVSLVMEPNCGRRHEQCPHTLVMYCIAFFVKVNVAVARI